MTIVLTEQIPSGKNRIKERFIKGKKIRYPDARFTSWREIASLEILQQKRAWTTKEKMQLPLRGDLRLTISYHPLDKITRDVDGMQGALFHLLGYNELIDDDKQIKSLTWEYPWRTEGPCVKLIIEQT